MCNQFSLCRSVEDRGGIRSRFVMLSLMLSFILVMAEGVAVPAPAVAQETGEVSTSQTTNGETTNGESRPSTEENVSERQSAIATLLQPVFSFFKAYNATANSVADSASNVANKAEKWAEVSLQSGKSALGDSDLTGAESAGPEGLDQVQSPSVEDGQAAAPAELLSRGRAIRAIRLLIVACLFVCLLFGRLGFGFGCLPQIFCGHPILPLLLSSTRQSAWSSAPPWSRRTWRRPAWTMSTSSKRWRAPWWAA